MRLPQLWEHLGLEKSVLFFLGFAHRHTDVHGGFALEHKED